MASLSENQDSRAAFRIDVEQCPRDHVGLGTGTQLALAMAAGLSAFSPSAPRSAIELARCVHRGERSSIGVHGFQHGGLLVEAGKLAAGEIGPLIARVELPSAWRFLVVVPRRAAGISGELERQAFARLPAPPGDVTAALAREALLELLPAAMEADFAAFGRSLYRFGRLAGSCFAGEQAGIFLDVQTSARVALLRSLGVEGVAQSSWGPSVAALLPAEAAGVQLIADLQKSPLAADCDLLLCAPLNSGAVVEPVPFDSIPTPITPAGSR